MMDEETRREIARLDHQMTGVTELLVNLFLDFHALKTVLDRRARGVQITFAAARSEVKTFLGAGFEADKILRQAEAAQEMRRRLEEFEGEPQ